MINSFHKKEHLPIGKSSVSKTSESLENTGLLPLFFIVSNCEREGMSV